MDAKESNKLDHTYRGIFIRAPGIVSLDCKDQIRILATLPRRTGGVTACSGIT